MKYLDTLVGLLLLTPVAVVASGASLRVAYEKIDADTKQLTVDVNNFKDRLTFTPVASQTTKTIGDTDEGTLTAEQSAPLTSAQTFEFVNPLIELVDDTTDALSAIRGKAALFKSTGTAPLALNGVRLAKAASDRFEAAVAAKVPEGDLRNAFGQIIAPLDPAYDQTIAALS